MPLAIPRDIQAIIYQYVLDYDETERSPFGGRWYPSGGLSRSTFLLLARVDRWSYNYVIQELFRPSRYDQQEYPENHPGALLRIDPSDIGRGRDQQSAVSFDNPHVLPYLLRYHNLRRINRVRFNGPCNASIEGAPQFLAHIGEPGPVLRNIELSFGWLDDDPDIIHLPQGSELQRCVNAFAKLYQPRIVIIETIITVINTRLSSPIYALARCFADTPIRTNIASIDVLKNDRRSRPQSPHTWIQYIDKGDVKIPPTGSSNADSAMHPDLDGLFAFIKYHLIDRPRTSPARIDLVLPNVDVTELDKLSAKLVDAETGSGHYRRKRVDYVDSTRSASGVVGRLRGLRLVNRIEELYE